MNRIDVDMGDLYAFLAVAEKLHFRAAAEELFLSQPALSRRIEKLEGATGVRLLDRSSRRVALTESGRLFLQHARSIVEELEAAVHGASDSVRQRASLVTVACVPSVVHNVLPNLLKTFSLEFPRTRVHIIDESGEEVLRSVVSAVADFGINFTGAQEADIDFTPIYGERYVLAARRDHRLAQRKSLAWKDLVDETFISVSARSSNRVLLDHALAKLSARPTVTYEVNHVTGALSMVAAGLGVAAVPALAMSREEHPSLVSIPLTHPTVSRTLGAIVRKGSVLAPPAQALLDLLRKAAKNGFAGVPRAS
jgi:DNA-binding transcriptional LysR family regulator